MVIAALLFTLVECSRYMMLGMVSVINSQSVTESVFAEYHIPAYQNYHLLLLDGSYGTGELLLSDINARMQKLSQENLNPTVRGFGKYSNFLQMNVTDSSVVRYELATDNNADSLLRQMSQVIKQELAADLLEHAYEKVTGIQDSYSQGKNAEKYLEGALDTIEQAKEEQSSGQDKRSNAKKNAFRSPKAAKGKYGVKNKQKKAKSSNQNVMEDVKSAKSSLILRQILSGENAISGKSTEKDDAVERRNLHTGNFRNKDSSGAADKPLIIQYLKKYTSNYRNNLQVPHALMYEQEYILFGKYSDKDNLEKMASRLVLLREGINFAYLMTDSAKQEEALFMATAIAAAAAIPAAVKAIQMGLLASWAYAESIMEVRTLFSGGKIAAVKTAENWTVSLTEAAAVLFNTSVKAKEVSGGISYEDYLHAFLTLESKEKIGIRFANLLEKNFRMYAGYEQVKADCMITAMETNLCYHASQAFLTFVMIGDLSKKGYKYEEAYIFSYNEKDD